MAVLLALDQYLFLLVNHLPHSSITDNFFRLVSDINPLIWLLFFLYIFGLVVIHKKNAGRGFVFLVLATLSGFGLNTLGFKEFFHRPRPFISLEGVVLIQRGLTDYSFPSGHAFSAALLATIFIRRPNILQPLLVYAILVGFSRVYLGVHFPSDVLGGFAFGYLYGLSVNHFYERFLEKEEFHILKHHVESQS